MISCYVLLYFKFDINKINPSYSGIIQHLGTEININKYNMK